MKRSFTILAALLVLQLTAAAQEAPVFSVGPSAPVQKTLFGGWYPYNLPVHGPIDGAFFMDTGDAIVSLGTDYIEKSRVPAPREGKFKSGVSEVRNGNRLYYFYGYYAKKITHLLACAYDLPQMTNAFIKEFHQATNIITLKKKSNWNFLPVSSGGAYDVRFSKNGNYIGVATYENRVMGRCFNLALYDRDFNLVSKQEYLDTTLVRAWEKEEVFSSMEGYEYDFAVADEGTLTFVRSHYTYFHKNSEGSDISVYILSKDGFRRIDFGTALERNDFHYPKIIAAEADKIMVTGIYSDVSRFNGNYPTYLHTGLCTLSIPLSEGGSIEKLAWEKFDFLFPTTEQKPMFFPSFQKVEILTWDTPGGKAYLFNDKLAIIDPEGKILSIKKLPAKPFEENTYRIIDSGRLYWMTLTAAGGNLLYGVDWEGNVTRTPVPAFYAPGVAMRTISLGEGRYQFVQCDASSMRTLNLTVPQ